MKTKESHPALIVPPDLKAALASMSLIALDDTWSGVKYRLPK